MSREVKHAVVLASKDRVVKAAREFLAELDSTPDLLRRAALRKQLANAVSAHDLAINGHNDRKRARP